MTLPMTLFSIAAPRLLLALACSAFLQAATVAPSLANSASPAAEPVCNDIKERVLRIDCNVASEVSREEYLEYQGRFGGYPELREVCENTDSSTAIAKCYVAMEKVLTGRHRPLSEKLAQFQDCSAFFSDYNSKRAETLGGDYNGTRQPIVADSASCEYFANIRSMRKVAASPTIVCKQADDDYNRGKSALSDVLSQCIGETPGSQQHTSVWTESLDQCALGQNLAVVDRLRKTLATSGVEGRDPLIGCPQVFDVAAAIPGIEQQRIAAAKSAFESLSGKRPPMDVEAQEAFLEKMRAELFCDFRREIYCPITFRDDPRLDSLESKNDRMMEAMFDALNAAGVPSAGANSTNLQPTVMVGFNDVYVRECSTPQDGLYQCKLTVALACTVRGQAIFNGVDITGPAIAEVVCPRFTQPRERVVEFDWSGDRYHMLTTAFPGIAL